MTVAYDGSLFRYSVPELHTRYRYADSFCIICLTTCAIWNQVFLVLCNRLAAVVFAVAMAALV